MDKWSRHPTRERYLLQEYSDLFLYQLVYRVVCVE